MNLIHARLEEVERARIRHIRRVRRAYLLRIAIFRFHAFVKALAFYLQELATFKP